MIFLWSSSHILMIFLWSSCDFLVIFFWSSFDILEPGCELAPGSWFLSLDSALRWRMSPTQWWKNFPAGARTFSRSWRSLSKCQCVKKRLMFLMTLWVKSVWLGEFIVIMIALLLIFLQFPLICPTPSSSLPLKSRQVGDILFWPRKADGFPAWGWFSRTLRVSLRQPKEADKSPN